MKDNYAHIVIVLDRSGSMRARMEPTIEGFNAFITKQKEIPKECTVTLVQFDYAVEGPSGIEVMYDFKPLADVPLLTDKTYQPRGNTALLDAIGLTIDRTGKKLADLPEALRPAHVYFVIQTDGVENASYRYVRRPEDNAREFSQLIMQHAFFPQQPQPKPAISDMIKHQREKYNWDFIFLGADQDAILVAEQMNIPLGTTMSYAGGAAGTAATFTATAQNMAMAREQNVQFMSYDAGQRKRAMQKDDDAKQDGSTSSKS